MTWDEMLFLFGLSMVYAAAFRLTKNVAVLWPFYTPVGGLYSNLSEGLTLPFEATYGFALTLGLMVAALVVAAMLYARGQPDAVGTRLPVQARQQESGIG